MPTLHTVPIDSDYAIRHTAYISPTKPCKCECIDIEVMFQNTVQYTYTLTPKTLRKAIADTSIKSLDDVRKMLRLYAFPEFRIEKCGQNHYRLFFGHGTDTELDKYLPPVIIDLLPWDEIEAKTSYQPPFYIVLVTDTNNDDDAPDNLGCFATKAAAVRYLQKTKCNGGCDPRLKTMPVVPETVVVLAEVFRKWGYHIVEIDTIQS